MFVRVAFLLLTLACCNAVLYSSFWAPLFNPRILNFRVDTTFDPETGRRDRQNYVDNYGARGERLIDDLGNGKGPSDVPLKKDHGEVRFYYTYPGAPRQDQN